MRSALVAAIATVAAVVTAGCADFEDPTIVLDLRIIAVTATPPEQVIDVDLSADPATILASAIDQLGPVEVCATVAEPDRAGALRWSMTACIPDNERCDPTRPSELIATGVAPDPEASASPICAIAMPTPGLVAVAADALKEDPVHGAAGVKFRIMVEVGDDDGDPADDVFSEKKLSLQARIPEDRVPNHNPVLGELQYQAPELHRPQFGTCGSGVPRIVVAPNTEIDMVPAEIDATRENYPAATLDGTFERFDESITYQWLATAGSYDTEWTGGTRDPFGNEPPLSATWRAPDVERSTEVQLWMIQRDERGGATVYPTCIDVFR